jgi:hypothetical protein
MFEFVVFIWVYADSFSLDLSIVKIIGDKAKNNFYDGRMVVTSGL